VRRGTRTAACAQAARHCVGYDKLHATRAASRCVPQHVKVYSRVRPGSKREAQNALRRAALTRRLAVRACGHHRLRILYRVSFWVKYR